MDALDHRLVLVLGKGGVGRTTVAAATALACARRGRSTLLVEVHGAASAASLWGVQAPLMQPVPVAPGVDLLRLTAPGCLEEYGIDRLKLPWLARLVFGNRVIATLLDAIPGMADLLYLGKIDDVLEHGAAGQGPWQTVVVDAPATGHGLSLYATPQQVAEMTVTGPLHDESLAIAARLADPEFTALVLVTLPEDLPISEAEGLMDALGTARDVISDVVLNRVESARLPDPDTWQRILEALITGGHLPWARVGTRLAARRSAQEAMRRRLTDVLASQGVVAQVTALPRIHDAGRPAGIERLASALARHDEVGS